MDLKCPKEVIELLTVEAENIEEADRKVCKHHV